MHTSSRADTAAKKETFLPSSIILLQMHLPSVRLFANGFNCKQLHLLFVETNNVLRCINNKLKHNLIRWPDNKKDAFLYKLQ